uniref:Uncharacterized protein n=1 Tax=Aegilops tauschii subsp. strangulata TaxID=200361 RepID=A0A453QEL8_AEGTS
PPSPTQSKPLTRTRSALPSRGRSLILSARLLNPGPLLQGKLPPRPLPFPPPLPPRGSSPAEFGRRAVAFWRGGPRIRWACRAVLDGSLRVN